MTKKGAFDPGRLDDDLDELLPPVPLKLVPVAAPPVVAPEDSEPIALRPVRPTRSKGNRPEQVTPRLTTKPARTPKPKASVVTQTSAAADSAEGQSVVVAAARLPQDLYDALTAFLSGTPERPSYAQLISWTCQDQPAAVVHDLVLSAEPQARVPRGRAKAAPFALVTPRFLPEEIGFVDAVQRMTADQTGQSITRTQVICAAIRVAIRNPV